MGVQMGMGMVVVEVGALGEWLRVGWGFDGAWSQGLAMRVRFSACALKIGPVFI